MHAMDTTILLALVLIPAILIFILIVRFNRNQWRRIQEMWEKDSGFDPPIRHAIETEATIISKNETIVPNAAGFAKVDLQLELSLPGAAPYQVSTCWLVKIESLDEVLPGKQVPIKVDPKRTTRIFPNIPWATTWIFGK
jgi:hypothetical protein